jgi:4-hydroxy-3-methylbut-2-enyl diphosphate reductase
MKILLANPRGFCAGVNMAIECLDEAIRRVGPGIYVYHEIVHNKYVVERFTKQGVKFVDSLEEVPYGSILLFSAHGVSPEIRRVARERKLQTVDATCPLVTKVHLEAIRYANDGYNILLIGHDGHDEVIGTMGEAPQSITLVESPADVDCLTFSSTDKLAYLTQTTLSIDEAAAVIAALRSRYPHIECPKKKTSATPPQTARKLSNCSFPKLTCSSCSAAKTAQTAEDSWKSASPVASRPT